MTRAVQFVLVGHLNNNPHDSLHKFYMMIPAAGSFGQGGRVESSQPELPMGAAGFPSIDEHSHMYINNLFAILKLK